MEEIDLKELLLYFKSKLYMIILITFFIVALGMCYSIVFKKPVYTSSSTIVLASSDSNGSASSAQIDVAVNQKLVGTYREIVKSRSILESVIDSLDLNYTYEQLSSKVSVSSITDTEIIKISVTDGDPKQAKSIARSVASTFSKEISNIYKMKNVNILDEANLPSKASNMSFIKECILYFCIGVILSMVVLLIQFYFDTSIKSVEQVEAKLKLPIIGTVPLYSKGGK